MVYQVFTIDSYPRNFCNVVLTTYECKILSHVIREKKAAILQAPKDKYPFRYRHPSRSNDSIFSFFFLSPFFLLSSLLPSTLRRSPKLEKTPELEKMLEGHGLP